MEKFLMNGVDFSFEASFLGDIVRVYDVNGDMIGEAEFDHNCEHLSIEICEGGEEQDIATSYFEWDDRPRSELAEYIAALSFD